jgi:ribosomal protein S18
MPPKKTQRRRRRPEMDSRRRKPKPCQLCKLDYVDYKDVALLRKYMSDRGKIRSRRVTGNCSKHQREVARAVKNAREMGLLPYTMPRQ